MLSTARIGSDLWRPILAILLVALIAAACGAASLGGAPAAAPAERTSGEGGNPDLGQGQGLSGEQNNSNGESNGNNTNGNNGNGNDDRIVEYTVGQEGLLIIKNGTLGLQVTGIDAAVAAADRLITGVGGYASASDRSGDGESAQASVTYRIPAARWDEALTGLRDLGDKLLTERSSTEDVTSQVVDLGARIRNLEATERALQAIMDRATAIKDVLTVQAELTNVRSQIEQLTAQKTSLEAKAAFSTVTVTFSLKPNPVLVETQGFDAGVEAEAATASLVGVLQALATAGIWFGIVWLPILLALGLLGAIGVFIFRRVRPATGGSAGPPMAAPEAGA